MDFKDQEFIVIDGVAVPKENIRNAILTKLEEIKKSMNGKHFIIDEERINEFLKLANSVKSEFDINDEYVVQVEMFYPALSYGSITVTGKNINFNSEFLLELVRCSSEMEIAPYGDGSVSVIFGFRKLMRLE